MQKLLFFVVLALIVWRLLSAGKQRSNRQPPIASRPAEQMVVCARCGVHQPLSESVEADGRHYCCDAHRREAAGG